MAAVGLKSHSKDIFSPAWVKALRGAPEASMDASIRIFDPNLEGAILDPETNEYIVNPIIFYGAEGTLGKARVQPLRSANQQNNPGNPTTVQYVLFSIPVAYQALDLRPGLQVRVLTSELNPSLTKYLFVIHEVLDSSNPIEKTFICTANQEIVV